MLPPSLVGYCCGPCVYGMNSHAIGQSEDWIKPCVSVYIASICCLGWCKPSHKTPEPPTASQLASLT